MTENDLRELSETIGDMLIAGLCLLLYAETARATLAYFETTG